MSISIGISGEGQHHTNKHGDNPYQDITLSDIHNLVDSPQQVAKEQAQWLIPSTHHHRAFKEQERYGEYHLLWCDFDEDPLPLSGVAAIVDVLKCDYELYTSRSATQDKQKSRLLIPLSKPLCFRDWVFSQQCLNDYFDEREAVTDRASERSAQLCYLPNRGEYYDSISQRELGPFNPLEFFTVEIIIKQEALEAAQEAVEQRIRQSEAKRQERLNAGFSSIPEAFNAAYLPEDMMIQSGYDQRGNLFRHPESESGSYSASVKDGRVHSLSSNDPLYTSANGQSEGAHDAFSAFTVLFHGGDFNAALIDAGDNLLKIDGESWNTVKRREYAQKSEATIEEIREFKNANDNGSQHPLATVRPVIELSGRLKELQDYCEEVSTYPCRAFAGFTALAAFNAICGHKYIGPSGLKLTSYQIAIMPTASGKESQKAACTAILKSAGVGYRQISLGASKQGLFDVLNNKEIGEVIRKEGGKIEAKEAANKIESGNGAAFSALALNDEAHSFFANSRDTFKLEQRDLLLELYTASGRVVPPNAVSRPYLPLTDPCMSFYGFSVPEQMISALGNGATSGGFVGRCMFFASLEVPEKNYELLKNPPRLFNEGGYLKGALDGWLKRAARLDKPLSRVGWGEDGFEVWEEIDREVIEPMKRREVGEMAEIAGRLSAQTINIATLIAISECVEEPVVTGQHIKEAWAIRKSLHESFVAIVKSEGGFGASEDSRIVESVRKVIKRQQGKRLGHASLCRSCTAFGKLTARRQDDVIRQLEKECFVKVVTVGRGVSYELVN